MSKDDASTPGTPADATGRPVTVIRTRRAKRGHEKEVEEILAGIIQAATTFPGHKGAKMLRPTNPEYPDYQVVFTFDTASNFDRWETSETRRQWMQRLEAHVEAHIRTHFLTGLETWFTLGAPATGVVPPPRFKMALTTWLATYPLVTLLFFLLTAIPVGPATADAPAPGLLDLVFAPVPPLGRLFLKMLVLTGILAFLMTYVVMPRVVYFLRRWLYPHSIKRPDVSPGPPPHQA